MRTDPPWSPPVAMSTTPAASRAALPLDDPPADRVVSHGLRTGPLREVCEPPEKHRSSHTALPAMVAPAASSRLTTVASRAGWKPSRVDDPFIMGTPATAVLSLTATERPASGPSERSVIDVVTYQAPSGLSAGAGRFQGRSGACGACSAYSCSTASQELSRPPTAGANEAMSAGPRPRP